MKTVLYFGLFDPDFSRNKIYIRGLRENGYEVLVCTDTAPGMRKYWNLFWKHWVLRKQYDVMIVGYPGYIIAPFAKLITRKLVILDALCSYYESAILSRDAHKNIPFRVIYTHLIDWCATRSADVVLVETKAQQEYFERQLGVPNGKCVVVYTGVDDSVFVPDPTVQKYEHFTALFRGRITHEAGAQYVVRAAKLLEDSGVDVLIIGYGWNTEMALFTAEIEKLKPRNVRYIAKQLPIEELVELVQKCHVALGQFGTHERLKRTIPHKAFEALALGLPYITARAEGICEILQDEKNCLLVNPADASDLAKKIKSLHNDHALAGTLSTAGHTLYMERFTPVALVHSLVSVLVAYES